MTKSKTRFLTAGLAMIVLLAAALFVIVNFILTAVATGITDRLSSRTSAKVTRELIPGELDNPNPPTIQMFVLPGGRK